MKVGIVFAGISVEAWVKGKGEQITDLPLFTRRADRSLEIHAKRVAQEKEKAKINE